MYSSKMNNKYIQELDASIASAKETIELGTALERLFSNKDFKKVVLNGYFKDEAVRLVHLRGEPTNQSFEALASLDNKIMAISSFSIYLKNIQKEAELADKTVNLDEQTRNEISLEDN